MRNDLRPKKPRDAVYYLHEQQAPRPTHHNTVNQADVTGNAFVWLLVALSSLFAAKNQE